MRRMGIDEGRVEPVSSRARSIKRFSAVAIGLLIVSSLAVAAQAGPVKKQFTADVQPGIVNGSLVTNGFTTMTASVTNLNQSQQLGSAQFSVPSGSGFSIADHATADAASNPAAVSGAFVYPCDAQPSSSTTPCAEIENGGSTIEFDNLALLNGQTFSATFSVNVPTECVDRLPWTVLAHQANNFSANPGNFYTGPANVPTTTVVTRCSLNWTVQPADAEPSTTITGEVGTPSSANLITVKVQNGGTTILGANIPISLLLVPLDGAGGTLGGTTSTTASGGVATFAPTIDAVGNYQLHASSTGVTCSSQGASPSCGTSDTFSIVNDIAGCSKRVTCSTLTVNHGATQSGSTSAPNPPESNGHVLVAFDLFQGLDCSALGYTPVNDSVDFEYIPPAGSTVLTAINGTFSVPHSSTNQVCFASVASFSNTKKGFTTTPDGQKTITLIFDGVTYTVGVLDSCSKSNPAPCYNKTTGQQIDTFTIVGRDVDDMVGRS